MEIDLSVSYLQDRIASSYDEILFAQKISSLANSNGGKLIIGVNEKGKIIGIYPKDEIENIPIILANLCSSPIEFTSEVIELNNKFLLILKIFKSTKIATLTNDNTFDFYFRIGEKICTANKIIEKLWSYEYESTRELPGNSKELELVLLNANNHTLTQIYNSTKLPKSHVDTLVSWLLYTRKIEMTYINNLVIYQHLR